MNEKKFVKAAKTILDRAKKTARYPRVAFYGDDKILIQHRNPAHGEGLLIIRKIQKNPDFSDRNPRVSFPSDTPEDEDSKSQRLQSYFSDVYDHVVSLAEKVEKENLYLGYCHKKNLPVTKGTRIRIPKGTSVRSMGKRGRYKAGKTYEVTVDHVISGGATGYGSEKTTLNPEVVWPGSGGYWVGADINDVKILKD